jgi:hypothetical protein
VKNFIIGLMLGIWIGPFARAFARRTGEKIIELNLAEQKQ